MDTVGKNKAEIAEYIMNQLKEDEAVVRMTIDFDEDLFMVVRTKASDGPLFALEEGGW